MSEDISIHRPNSGQRYEIPGGSKLFSEPDRLAIFAKHLDKQITRLGQKEVFRKIATIVSQIDTLLSHKPADHGIDIVNQLLIQCSKNSVSNYPRASLAGKNVAGDLLESHPALLTGNLSQKAKLIELLYILQHCSHRYPKVFSLYFPNIDNSSVYFASQFVLDQLLLKKV